MRNRFCRMFLWSSAGLLLATAAAKLYGSAGTVRILAATDPLIHFTYRQIMIGTGLLEACTAIYLLGGRNPRAKLWLVLWLGANFMIYRMANEVLHVRLCPCLGTINR